MSRPGAESRQQYVRRISEYVAVEYDVNPDDVLGRSQNWLVSEARWLVMRHCIDQGWTYAEVGRAFGRDRSTVYYALDRTRIRGDFARSVLRALPLYEPPVDTGAVSLAARWAGAL